MDNNNQQNQNSSANKSNDVIEIDVVELFGLIVSKLWIVILSGMLVGLATFLVLTYLITPKYESTTKIYVINRQNNDALTYSDLQSGTQLTKDYQELVKSRPVLEEVKAELNLKIDDGDLMEQISVSVPTDTRIVSITVEDADPYMARAIVDRVRLSASQHIADVMSIEAVNVVEEANLPLEPSSPKTVRDTLIGFVIGMLIAIAVIVVIYIMDDTIKNPEDVEKYLHLSVLGSIPVVDENAINGTSKGKGRRKGAANYSRVVEVESVKDMSQRKKNGPNVDYEVELDNKNENADDMEVKDVNESDKKTKVEKRKERRSIRKYGKIEDDNE